MLLMGPPQANIQEEQPQEENNKQTMGAPKKQRKYRLKLMLMGFVFFVGAMLVSGFLFFSGNNNISGGEHHP